MHAVVINFAFIYQMQNLKNILFLFCGLFIIPFFAISQDTLTKKEWRKQQKSFLLPGRPWTVEVPVWIPGFAGTFAYGDVELEGEDGSDPEDPGDPGDGGGPGTPPIGNIIGDVFSRLFQSDFYLKFFYIGKIGYQKNWFISEIDAVGGAIGTTVLFKPTNRDVFQLNFRVINTRFIIGYKVLQADSKKKNFRYNLFAYTGVRTNFMWVYSDLNQIINKLDLNVTSVQPVFGIYNQFQWKRWQIILKGDYGGMFTSEKYSFNYTTLVYYRTGRLTSLKFGWNHLFMRQDGTFRNEPYHIQVRLAGPTTSVVFHF
jgi:hypothetical protein